MTRKHCIFSLQVRCMITVFCRHPRHSHSHCYHNITIIIIIIITIIMTSGEPFLIDPIDMAIVSRFIQERRNSDNKSNNGDDSNASTSSSSSTSASESSSSGGNDGSMSGYFANNLWAVVNRIVGNIRSTTFATGCRVPDRVLKMGEKKNPRKKKNKMKMMMEEENTAAANNNTNTKYQTPYSHAIGLSVDTFEQLSDATSRLKGYANLATKMPISALVLRFLDEEVSECDMSMSTVLSAVFLLYHHHQWLGRLASRAILTTSGWGNTTPPGLLTPGPRTPHPRTHIDFFINFISIIHHTIPPITTHHTPPLLGFVNTIHLTTIHGGRPCSSSHGATIRSVGSSR